MPTSIINNTTPPPIRQVIFRGRGCGETKRGGKGGRDVEERAKAAYSGNQEDLRGK